MVGSHFLASTRFSCAAAGRVDPRTLSIPVERFDPLDLSDPEGAARYVRSTDESCIVNFAARTDVDGVERERPPAGRSEGGAAWAVNALTPAAVAEAAHEGGKRLIHLSTDFVFDGTEGPYAEQAPRSPLTEKLSWYGWTKSEGERRILDADSRSTVIRIAYPYRSNFPPKLDFARRIVESRRQGRLPPLYVDQQITPTWIPDLTRVVELSLDRRPSGIFHVASPELTTPFDFGRELLLEIEGHVPDLIPGRMTATALISGRAPRPIRGGLRISAAEATGISPTGWRQGIHRLVEEELWAP